MRRIIESTLLSLDGVIGSPHLWASERFDEGSRSAALAQLKASDAMLMGRRTYEIFSGQLVRETVRGSLAARPDRYRNARIGQPEIGHERARDTARSEDSPPYWAVHHVLAPPSTGFGESLSGVARSPPIVRS